MLSEGIQNWEHIMPTITIKYQYPDQPQQFTTVNISPIMAEIMVDELSALGATASFEVIR